MLKKKLVILGMFASLIGVQGASQQAHAIIGLVTANPVMTIAGAIVLGASPLPLLGLTACLEQCDRSDSGQVQCQMLSRSEQRSCDQAKIISPSISIPAFLTGLILLDRGDQVIPVFEPIHKSDQTRKLGVSPREIEIYNHEIEELNAVRESVQAEANAFLTRGGKFTPSKAQALWRDHRGEFSPETAHVVQRILEHAFGTQKND